MSNTDPLQYLRETKAKVDPYIFNFLPKEHEHPEIQQCYEMMLDYPLRAGKGLRPAICLLMCEAFGGDPDAALSTAAALELLQNWLLIHDDIEDGSDLRRGEPCLHKKYGVPMAINIGDALHCKMWEMLHMNKDALGYELAFEVLSEFIHLSNQVVEGQHIELSWVKNQRWNLTEEDYWTMCVKKTASYTVITPCRLGALIAGAPKARIEPFYDIGGDLGVAFQIQDDALNLIGEEGQYGKEIAGDISEGKRTLALIHVLNACTPAEASRVIEIMNKPREEKQPDEIQEVLRLIGKYGSIAYTQQRSRMLAQRAHAKFEREFADLPASRAKEVFLRLIHFVIEREY
jgi:geranylgeranyl diphosphate synthase type II